MRLRAGSSQSRLAAFGLLLVVLAAFYLVVATPLWRLYTENREAISDYRESIARFRQIAEQRPQLESALAALEKRRDLVGYALPRTSATLAAASLQEQVKGLTGSNGGALISTQVLPVTEAGKFRRVSVSVRMNVSTEGLQAILHSLEVGRPALFIDNVVVIPRATRGSDGVRIEQLDVRFDVSGYIRAGSPEEAGLAG